MIMPFNCCLITSCSDAHKLLVATKNAKTAAKFQKIPQLASGDIGVTALQLIKKT